MVEESADSRRGRGRSRLTYWEFWRDVDLNSDLSRGSGHGHQLLPRVESVCVSTTRYPRKVYFAATHYLRVVLSYGACDVNAIVELTIRIMTGCVIS